MTSFFNAKIIELRGLNLIEASAGTGKTYTLAELYCRLIVEKDLKVSEILVVTYTRAATEELRDRLRQKLVDTRDELLDEDEDFQTKNARLTQAIQSFDEATIFTIHGFCQRVLTDFAFESGLRFDLALIGDDISLLQSASDDFWRREVSAKEKGFIDYLLAKNQSPETLLKSIRSLVGKPYIKVLPVPEYAIASLSDDLQITFSRLQTVWLSEHEQVVETLNNTTLLNGNKYRKANVKKWLVLLMKMMSDTTIPTTLFEGFEKFTQGKMEEGLKKGQGLPELHFWQQCERLWEQYQQLQTALACELQLLRVQLLAYLTDTLPEQKRQNKVQSYDDLLLNLDHALQGERGDWLVEQCRKQYQAALIDEFQDTDPVQFRSFSRIYADSGLPTFLVGDPKQAIYSFRGADIFTYLQAKSHAEHVHTLGTNWRSHPDLVGAVNVIFSRRESAFMYDDIPFNSVDAQRDDEAVLVLDNNIDSQEQPQSALQVLWLNTEEKNTKTALMHRAAECTADEITVILNQAQAGTARLKNAKTSQYHAVSGGDIAVLVRNHKQAKAIQQCLQQRGVNSVQQGRETVFSSQEAMVLLRVLQAIAQPNNQSLITAALATPLWGLNSDSLYQLKQDDVQWQAQCDVFYEWHQLWITFGFMRVFRQILSSLAVPQRLLNLQNGDRQLTNLNHLAELLQTNHQQHSHNMALMITWLSQHINDADGDNEQAQLRLESDEQLVKIITIHKSKGLEYPIVFCPFLWDANLRSAKDEVVRFHQDDETKQNCAAFSEPDLSLAKESVTVEEQAEDIRLLYVALTRARERCVILWGNIKQVEKSALFGLLHPSLAEANTDTMIADLKTLSATHLGQIGFQSIGERGVVSYQEKEKTTQVLAAKNVTRRLYEPWRIGSFSALTKGHDAELPDYDLHTENEVVATVIKSTTRDRFSFPRGAQAGICLHSLFELWDFSSDDDAALKALVNRTLLNYGFNETWTPIACEWMKEVVATPLDDNGLSLSKLKPAQRLDELAFYFPVAQLTVAKIRAEVLPLLNQYSPLRQVIERLNFYDLTGFMKGFIDLVFEAQGRFYIVDYKSNHLGDTPQQYHAGDVNNAMIAHDYPLQCLIYTVALHRYLRLRLADYDPEQHLGGAYYLFIRGMKHDWRQEDGTRAGIFYDKPDISVIDALDRCLQDEQG